MLRGQGTRGGGERELGDEFEDVEFVAGAELKEVQRRAEDHDGAVQLLLRAHALASAARARRQGLRADL